MKQLKHKYHVVVIAAFVLMLLWQLFLRFCTLSPNTNYQQFASIENNNNVWTSFDFSVSKYYNDKKEGTNRYHLCYCYDKENEAIYFLEEDTIPKRIIQITSDTLRVVDFIYRELSSFNKGAFRYQGTWYWLYKDETYSKMQFLPFYTSCLPTSMRPDNEKYNIIMTKTFDTIVSNVKSKVIIGRTLNHNEYNETTSKFDIPCHYSCSTWINSNSFEVDSVTAVLIGKNAPKRIIKYELNNINHHNMANYYDSVFNFNNPCYKDFSVHNDSNPPISRLTTSCRIISKELMEFPIVSLNMDTISISEKSNWLLLDLWSFNCPSCIKALELFGMEKDTIGKYHLETKEISILSINYSSDNMELINKVANKTNTADIMYSAKGLNTLISIPTLGYYYLLSPNKEIVYETSYLGDYSELLKVKADYERQHQKE